MEPAGLSMSYSMGQMVRYMAKLGTIGSGGPVALVRVGERLDIPSFRRARLARQGAAEALAQAEHHGHGRLRGAVAERRRPRFGHRLAGARARKIPEPALVGLVAYPLFAA